MGKEVRMCSNCLKCDSGQSRKKGFKGEMEGGRCQVGTENTSSVLVQWVGAGLHCKRIKCVGAMGLVCTVNTSSVCNGAGLHCKRIKCVGAVGLVWKERKRRFQNGDWTH